MTLKYLLDENVSPVYQTQLLQRSSSLAVLVVGDTDAPSKGTLDPEILCWLRTTVALCQYIWLTILYKVFTYQEF